MSSTKKTLYRPAPELLEHRTANLVHGSSSTCRAMKIKQGVLESGTRPSANKRLTSTLKSRSSVSERHNPLVVCHNLGLTQMQSSGNVATNTTVSPTVVVINRANKDKGAVKKSARKVYHVKSKFKTAPPANHSAPYNSTLNSSRSSRGSLNASSSLQVEKPQKTSTPSLKHRLDWSCNESVISKSDTTQMEINEEQGIKNTHLVHPSCGVRDDSEIWYCRYLQAKHLEQLAASSREKKADRASCALSFLCDKSSRLDEELFKLEDEVSELQHLSNLKCMLEQQKHSLAPSVDKLMEALAQYHVFCKNLDTTTHHMPLIDIHNPAAGEMEKELNESRILIGQINILLKSKMSQIHQAAEAMRKLSVTCEREATNIPHVTNCAADMSSLVMEFGSLIAQLTHTTTSDVNVHCAT